MQPTDLTQIAPSYATTTGLTRHGVEVTSLYKTHATTEDGRLIELKEKTFIRLFQAPVTDEQLQHEMMLNDWSRWRKELKPNCIVEVSEYIYFDMFECLPPKNINGSYFEVGEPHPHDNTGKPIHRAFWMDADCRYYTGYPKP